MQCSQKKIRGLNCCENGQGIDRYLMHHLPGEKQLEICVMVLAALHRTLVERKREDLRNKVENELFDEM